MTNEPNQSDTSREIAERWVEEHADYLFRYAYSRVGHVSEAEDLAQETLIEGIKKADSFEGRSNERTWLTGILRNKIKSHFRRQTRGPKIEELDAKTPPYFDRHGHWNPETRGVGHKWNPDPGEALQSKEFYKILTECISKLPKNAAAVFTLREMEAMTTKLIAQELSISESNIWTLLHRARLQLRSCLSSNDIRSKDMKK